MPLWSTSLGNYQGTAFGALASRGAIAYGRAPPLCRCHLWELNPLFLAEIAETQPNNAPSVSLGSQGNTLLSEEWSVVSGAG